MKQSSVNYMVLVASPSMHSSIAFVLTPASLLALASFSNSTYTPITFIDSTGERVV